MIITEHNIRSVDDAFLYYTDCELATLIDMAMKKSKPKNEYIRHKAIAKGMIEIIIGHKLDYKDRGTRIDKVIACGGIDNYVKEYEPKND